MSSRRALLRHLWAMVQTRTEAAVLVVQLQRSALAQGLLHYGIAALAAMSFVIAAVVLIAIAVPAPWNAIVLGLLAAALLAVALAGASRGTARLKRDVSLIADFTQGLKLDLAMVNLALKDPDTEDAEKLEAREQAKSAVREAAAEKSATPSTAEGGERPAPGGPAMEAVTGAMRAAGPAPDDPIAQTQPERAAAVAAAAGGATLGGAYASSMAVPDAGDTLPDGVTEREMPGGAPPPEAMPGATQAADRERSHGST